MAQDHMDSAGKGKSQMEPAHGPPLQARVAAANGTVLAACKLLVRNMMILAHMDRTGANKMNRTGASKLERGK